MTKEEKTPRKLTYYLGEDDAGERVDRVAADHVEELSRSQVQRLIDAGLVTLNDEQIRASQSVRSGDRLDVVIPPPEPTELVAEEIPLDIIHEDEAIVVVNKPAGLVVHPAPGHPRGTLVNALLARYPNLSVGGKLRPGIVHRLDKDTSGLLVVARNHQSHRNLVNQMKRRKVLKLYLVLVDGHMPEWEGVIDAPIARHPRHRKRMAVVQGGRAARTHYRVLEELGPQQLIEARLETGRTHQIRVHFAARGHPVLGDPTYGGKSGAHGLQRQFLHAHRLGFRHPVSGEFREFSAPLAEDLAQVLERLRRQYG